jgi:hypothetical protein
VQTGRDWKPVERSVRNETNNEISMRRLVQPVHLPGVHPQADAPISRTGWRIETLETSMTYQEKLQDPKWKEKREAIISRDKMCVFCGSVFGLQVHHSYYIAKRAVWDYPDDSLVTTCDSCHKEITQIYSSSFYNFELCACVLLKAVRESKLQSISVGN